MAELTSRANVTERPAAREMSTDRQISQDSYMSSIAETFYFRLNKCGVISPRFNVALGDLEKWVVRVLPARQFGHIVLTTSAGIMDHDQARRKHVSGKILGYFY
ncbi:hypothetical protein LCI18_004778 [Fusarium solani-melongenae]|uniref:Uncharacterized protein n=1 Tax=Fusarium solani subsp. cucurbitae TaxID=2747967 RepID=A0ACD3Z156_FUSSC|nr:hypothetical protein LCI18_004778 [Fusarium solani-melongenae]